MTRRAFTLIELMILIAVMGIVLISYGPAVEALVKPLTWSPNQIGPQAALTHSFALLRSAFRQSRRIASVTPDEIRFTGGEVEAIRREESGTRIVVIKNGARLPVDVLGAAAFGPWDRLDDRSVWGPLQIGDMRLPMVWRCSR